MTDQNILLLKHTIIETRSVCHTTSTVTGGMSAVLSTSGLALTRSGIGMIAGTPMTALAGLFGFISTAFIIGAKDSIKKLQHIKRQFQSLRQSTF